MFAYEYVKGNINYKVKMTFDAKYVWLREILPHIDDEKKMYKKYSNYQVKQEKQSIRNIAFSRLSPK